MIELGKKQTLQVVKSVEFGVYLAEDMNADTKHQVLLPAKQVPAGTKAGAALMKRSGSCSHGSGSCRHSRRSQRRTVILRAGFARICPRSRTYRHAGASTGG